MGTLAGRTVISILFCFCFILGYKIPFKWGVHFDDGEIAVTCAATALNTCEQGMAAAGTGVPNGMIGFNMLYWQVGPLTIAAEVHHCHCPFIFAVFHSSLPLPFSVMISLYCIIYIFSYGRPPVPN